MDPLFLLVACVAGAVLIVVLAGGKLNANRRQIANDFVESIDREKQLMLSGPNPQIPDLLPSDYGYRPTRGEQLLAVQGNVSLMEMRSTGRYINAGPVLSIPIAKGLRFRVAAGQYASQKALKATATGRLIVTDKAVVFESTAKNERITWASIGDIDIAMDGYGVAKRTGARKIYKVPAPDPKFAAIVELMLDLQQE